MVRAASNQNPVFNEMKGRVEVYSKEFHNQSATCSVFVCAHNPNPRWPGMLGHGRYDISHDVVRASVDGSMAGATAQLVLLPRRPYRDMFGLNDQISIYFSTRSTDPAGFGVLGQDSSPEDNDRVLWGKVDSCLLDVQVDESTGTHKIRYNMSCSGVIKVFDKTDVYYNEMLGPDTLFGAMLPGLSTLTKNVPLAGTPATIPRSVALTYLGYGGQFLLPDTYPIGEVARDRGFVLNSFLERSIRAEEDIGFLAVRAGVPNQAQRETVIQRLNRRERDQSPGNAITSYLDLFTYVEDKFVDGRVVNTPTTDLSGSVWSLMQENSNPAMNECFLSLLPTELSELKATKDEWGQSPQVVPCLVLRERPFSWLDYTFEVPTKQSGQKRKLRFGNVAFSSRDLPESVPHLQATAEQLGGFQATGFGTFNTVGTGTLVRHGLLGSRKVDRIQIRPQDILSESTGPADNDLYNFFFINPTALPMAHVRWAILKDGLIPIFLPRSIEKHGLRVRELSTKFIHTGGGRATSAKAFDFVIRMLLAQDLWYQHNPYYLAGRFTIPGMPKAKVGMFLDIGGRRQETYYVEGVNHEWEHTENGGMLRTTLTVTRGQPSGYDNIKHRFPYAAPDPIRVFDASGKEIERRKYFMQPKVNLSAVNPNNDVEMAKILDLPLKDYQTYKKEAAEVNRDVLDYLVEENVILERDRKHAQAMTTPTYRDVEPPAMHDRRVAGDSPWIQNDVPMWDPIPRFQNSAGSTTTGKDILNSFGFGDTNKK